MNLEQKEKVEELQRMVVKIVALNPAGRNLLLIGGFRFRFLDQSVRVSDDIDYHWTGSLKEKKEELLSLFERKLFPEVRRKLGYECQASPETGPGEESPVVQSIKLAFWKEGVSFSRIEIPIDITRIKCADPVAIRTMDGGIYPTASDADVIESKVTALFNRVVLRHRDLVDIYLFSSHLLPDSPCRLAAKCRSLDISMEDVYERIRDFKANKNYYIRTVQEVVDTQLDPAPAAQIQAAGGGGLVMDDVLVTLDKLFPAGVDNEGT